MRRKAGVDAGRGRSELPWLVDRGTRQLVKGYTLLARLNAGEEYIWWLARAGRCGGAGRAQGRAEGPDAQRLGESGTDEAGGKWDWRFS